MKNYVADELANKVYHLSKALRQAELIIYRLDEENKLFKETLSNLGLYTEIPQINTQTVKL